MTLKLLGTIARVWFKNVAWKIEKLKRQSDIDGRLQALNCPKLLCLTSGLMMAMTPPPMWASLHVHWDRLVYMPCD